VNILKVKELAAKSLEATQEIAEQLGEILHAGDVITLEGDLGAGKTSFTKGLARGLGITRNVSSPTFTIVKEYNGRLPLYHMDAYRLEDSEEDIGFDEYFNGNGVSVIEWAQFIEDYLPEERLEIMMEYTGENTRQLTFKANGARYSELLNEIDG